MNDDNFREPENGHSGFLQHMVHQPHQGGILRGKESF